MRLKSVETYVSGTSEDFSQVNHPFPAKLKNAEIYFLILAWECEKISHLENFKF